MISPEGLQILLQKAFTLDVTRWPDEPIRPPDRAIYTDPETGRSIVARAPLDPTRPLTA